MPVGENVMFIFFFATVANFCVLPWQNSKKGADEPFLAQNQHQGFIKQLCAIDIALPKQSAGKRPHLQYGTGRGRLYHYDINQGLRKEKCFERLAKFLINTAPQPVLSLPGMGRAPAFPIRAPQKGGISLVSQAVAENRDPRHVHHKPAAGGNASHRSDVFSTPEQEALAAEKARKQPAHPSIRNSSHVLIITGSCSRMVVFIWWTQLTTVAWIWPGVCPEVCFDLTITLKRCLDLFLCVHVCVRVRLYTWKEIPSILVLFEWVLSIAGHLSVTVLLKGGRKGKRYFNPFAHNWQFLWRFM